MAVSAGERTLCPWQILRSLSKALLYGHIGELSGELLDHTHVDLGAEGDVQQAQLSTRLEQFLQRGRTHQTRPEYVEVLQRGTAGSQLLEVRVAHRAVGCEEEFSEPRKTPGELLETPCAALESGTPAQVQLLQHLAARGEFSQSSVCQVSAAPEVQRAE